jgi:hypothetical protein
MKVLKKMGNMKLRKKMEKMILNHEHFNNT